MDLILVWAVKFDGYSLSDENCHGYRKRQTLIINYDNSTSELPGGTEGLREPGYIMVNLFSLIYFVRQYIFCGPIINMRCDPCKFDNCHQRRLWSVAKNIEIIKVNDDIIYIMI